MTRLNYLKRLQYGLLMGLTMALCGLGGPAIAQLSPPAPISEPPVIVQAVPTLEQQAQAAYEQGQYQTAADQLQQAITRSRSQAAPSTTAMLLGNLSLTYQALGDWDAADIALQDAWDLVAQQTIPQELEAQLLDTQGQLHFARGELLPALRQWQRTAELYQQLNHTELYARSLMLQAQALQAQGLFHQVTHILQTLQTELANEPDSAMKATALRRLGDHLRATGHLKSRNENDPMADNLNAEAVLQESLAIAQRLQNPTLITATTLSMGNLRQSQFQREDSDDPEDNGNLAQQALEEYTKVFNQDSGSLGIQAGLNILYLLTNEQNVLTNERMAQWRQEAVNFYPEVRQALSHLTPGRMAVYGHIGLAESLLRLSSPSAGNLIPGSEIVELLAAAQQQAIALGDERSQSLVLGTLGQLYQQAEQWDEALRLSQQALNLAQKVRADDIRYRWQWQLGQLYNAQNQTDNAISAYSQAFETLQSLRSDLLTANPDVQFTFRSNVEPIYRELVGLLLDSVPDLTAVAHHKASNADAQANLRQARDVMEALQVAELENFFQAACIEKTVNIDEVVTQSDPTAAIIYAILLPDRLEVVLKQPQQDDLAHFGAPRQEVDTLLAQYRANLKRGNNVRQQGQQLYTWLLKPAVDQGLLSTDAIKTLIFVLDGNLRLIPMATLHDGESFLLKKYALSLTLGLDIRNPQTLPPREQLSVLAAGLTDPPSNQGDGVSFNRLPYVKPELDKIAATELPKTLLRDEAFTQAALRQALNDTDYNIVHLATHGQFSGDRQKTFILAADGTINIGQLGNIFRSRRQANTNLEILILSACKTAEGDSRVVLGIAGATVQSGARSTIATLWSVDDKYSVDFAEELYTHLGKPGISRAEALRLAQVKLFEANPRKPRYWAPYVLVGSWR